MTCDPGACAASWIRRLVVQIRPRLAMPAHRIGNHRLGRIRSFRENARTRWPYFVPFPKIDSVAFRRIGPWADRASTTLPFCVATSLPSWASRAATSRTEGMSDFHCLGASLRATSDGQIVLPGSRSLSKAKIASSIARGEGIEIMIQNRSRHPQPSS